MDSRERVLRAIYHQEPDRVPTFFRRHSIPGRELSDDQMAYVRQAADIGPYLNMRNPAEKIVHGDKGDISYDELGIGRKYTGLYWDIVDFPLAHMKEPEELRDYPWPHAFDAGRTSGMRAEVLQLRAQGKATAVMGSWGGSTGIFEMSWYMRGMDNFLVDLMINRPFAETLLDIQLELHKRRWKLILDEVHDVADLVCIGDDLATQANLLISPDTYRISYNSCRNRHCPKCQTLKKERWIDARKDDLLDVGYFHVVFTLPDMLNHLAYQNQKIIYDILFSAAAETLSELCADKKYLGAQIGFTQILHTWGQNLMHHPHIHCIVPAGGLNSIGQWVHSRKKFFIPVMVLSRKFRGKFLFFLKQAKLEFYGITDDLKNKQAFDCLMSALYQKDWVVYCKPPFKSANHVVEYLGRYTHRIAISNNRILKLENGQVSFSWRDYRDSKKQKTMVIAADEFIRRFLIHVLPKHYTKIRHYGILSPRNKTTKLLLCKKLTHTIIRDNPTKQLSALEFINI